MLFMSLGLTVSHCSCRCARADHPYRSGVRDRVNIHVEGAAALLVAFDRRCHVNPAHAVLNFFGENRRTDEPSLQCRPHPSRCS